MTQDKELLLKDLCARLPYGVKIKTKDDDEPYSLLAIHPNKDVVVIGLQFDDVYATSKIKIDEVKPYLRPMSSMTEEERETLNNIPIFKSYYILKYDLPWEIGNYKVFDWLNRNHFDYRGLVPKGLAIEVTEDNNPYKE